MPDTWTSLREQQSPDAPVRLVLTAVEFDVLWDDLGLGPTPAVLRLASPGRTRAERREVQTAGLRALGERGLAGPTGAGPELARLVRLLARPVEQLELRGWWGRSVRAVAARGQDAGVLAVRQDGTVTLTACESLPSGLIGTLPPVPPGTSRSGTVPTGVLAGALATADVVTALTAENVPLPEARMLDRVLGATDRSAQVVALGFDRWGGARRVGGVLGILDSRHGRHLMTRSVGPDGVEWTTVAPADTRGLRRRISELLEGAVDPPANRPEHGPATRRQGRP